MYRIWDAIVTLHDMRLVVLSALLSLFACATAMTMLARARNHAGRVSLIWAIAAGVVSGCGIWAMHFVAMLAFDPGFPISYEIGFTALSIIVAVVVSAAGFVVALRPSSK